MHKFTTFLALLALTASGVALYGILSLDELIKDEQRKSITSVSIVSREIDLLKENNAAHYITNLRDYVTTVSKELEELRAIVALNKDEHLALLTTQTATLGTQLDQLKAELDKPREITPLQEIQLLARLSPRILQRCEDLVIKQSRIARAEPSKIKAVPTEITEPATPDAEFAP